MANYYLTTKVSLNFKKYIKIMTPLNIFRYKILEPYINNIENMQLPAPPPLAKYSSINTANPCVSSNTLIKEKKPTSTGPQFTLFHKKRRPREISQRKIKNSSPVRSLNGFFSSTQAPFAELVRWFPIILQVAALYLLSNGLRSFDYGLSLSKS